MATILDELADYARLRVEKAKAIKSAEEVKSLALALPKDNFSFEFVLFLKRKMLKFKKIT